MSVEVKKCLRCNIDKPVNEFVFDKRTNKYTNICIECNKKYHQEYYNKRKEQNKNIEPVVNKDEKKICIKCNKEKFLNEFSYDRGNGKYINICKECKAEATKEWYKNNKDKAKISGIEYRRKHKKHRQKHRKYYRE